MAYCLDEAVLVFGGWVTNELEKVKGKTDAQIQGRRELKLKALLDDNPDAQYATPSATR